MNSHFSSRNSCFVASSAMINTSLLPNNLEKHPRLVQPMSTTTRVVQRAKELRAQGIIK